MAAVMQTPAAEYPLVERPEWPSTPPTGLVIFGATGDLARRMLLPAIYNLAHDGALPARFELVGVSHSDCSDAGFREMVAGSVAQFSRRVPERRVLEPLLANAHHIGGTFGQPAVYEALDSALAEFDLRGDEPLDRCFYLSTPPRFFAPIVRDLAGHGLARRERATVRLVIEKPFGTTLAEARALNREVLSVFSEPHVFRIDHFLGKETVQDILALRFANHVFEPLWNRNHVDHVQITAAEDIGISGRADLYDSVGALRDLVQNHLLQLLCQMAIEPPANFSPDGVRAEKVKLLRAIEAPAPDEVGRKAARGQYTAGRVGGENVPAYIEEEGVPSDSTTETYAALRLGIANWRWAGVPFYLRTGKRLARELTEVALTLKPVPHLGFEQAGSVGARPNQLVLSVDPIEGASLLLVAKIPGAGMRLRPVKMEFLYGTAFGVQSPDAYERLLLDVMHGDQTLFAGGDEIEEQWRICEPVVHAWGTACEPPPRYPAGSEGPPEAASLMLPGHAWRQI